MLDPTFEQVRLGWRRSAGAGSEEPVCVELWKLAADVPAQAPCIHDEHDWAEPIETRATQNIRAQDANAPYERCQASQLKPQSGRCGALGSDVCNALTERAEVTLHSAVGGQSVQQGGEPASHIG
jgi:hypothetical protein